MQLVIHVWQRLFVQVEGTVAYIQVDVASGLEQVDRGADDVGGKRLFCCMGKEAGGG